ncbi:GDSL esterase/lipase At1g29670-like [Cynara cardunculus var. scolymus]|uniref:GDSL esterase/lipase At1g29670-like n=1 Tax=Cynara cardunculus var. scolymus TaxID=59895 RepID=UPI000D62F22B|nr:GDSL esterase/lipase At1g29670-like [Cynara cardunculus var. scolymus]
MVSDLILLFPLLIVMGLMQVQTFVVASQQPQVPCYFIFGDSSVDISGNNNRLNTTSKANYPPYGIDFPQGVTGRFTNGRTFADIIGQLLGFDKFIPPYATTTDEQNNKGVNYASAAAGIREETGSQLGERISFDRQLLNHNSTISHLSHLQRNTQFLKKCIYLVKIGINDYSNNYFVPDYYNTSRIYTTDQYATVLIQQYSQQLRTLYRLGGRKIAVLGLLNIGCRPAEIGRFGTDGKPCVESINDAVKLFNDKLKPLVDKLNNENSDARFTFINITSISSTQEGMRNGPCCEVGEGWVCIPNGSPCQDRALFTFYDGFHPTEASNTITATRAYTARSPMDASPYDISHLARLTT